jgi:hypothetical protein
MRRLRSFVARVRLREEAGYRRLFGLHLFVVNDTDAIDERAKEREHPEELHAGGCKLFEKALRFCDSLPACRERQARAAIAA